MPKMQEQERKSMTSFFTFQQQNMANSFFLYFFFPRYLVLGCLAIKSKVRPLKNLIWPLLAVWQLKAALCKQTAQPDSILFQKLLVAWSGFGTEKLYRLLKYLYSSLTAKFFPLKNALIRNCQLPTVNRKVNGIYCEHQVLLSKHYDSLLDIWRHHCTIQPFDLISNGLIFYVTDSFNCHL